MKPKELWEDVLKVIWMTWDKGGRGVVIVQRAKRKRGRKGGK